MSLVIALLTTLSAKDTVFCVYMIKLCFHVFNVMRLEREVDLGELVRKMTLVLDGSRLISTHSAHVVSPLS